MNIDEDDEKSGKKKMKKAIFYMEIID